MAIFTPQELMAMRKEDKPLIERIVETREELKERLEAPSTPIPEYIQKGLLTPVGLTGWTVEQMEAYPLTPEGMIHPESPLFQFITAPGEKITELVKETTYVELGKMPSPGVALPGIGEIKMPDIKMPDIFAGMKDIGKYALYGIGAIAGVILLSSFLKGRKT